MASAPVSHSNSSLHTIRFYFYTSSTYHDDTVIRKCPVAKPGRPLCSVDVLFGAREWQGSGRWPAHGATARFTATLWDVRTGKRVVYSLGTIVGRMETRKCVKRRAEEQVFFFFFFFAATELNWTLRKVGWKKFKTFPSDPKQIEASTASGWRGADAVRWNWKKRGKWGRLNANQATTQVPDSTAEPEEESTMEWKSKMFCCFWFWFWFLFSFLSFQRFFFLWFYFLMQITNPWFREGISQKSTNLGAHIYWNNRRQQRNNRRFFFWKPP